MKTNPVANKTATLEDIVFEDRNKSYGAYELNRQSRKYLMIAFLICFTGVSTAIAVPFLNSKDDGKVILDPDDGGVITLIDPDDLKTEILPPPAPVLPEELIKAPVFEIPVVVDVAPDDDVSKMLEGMLGQNVNPPVDLPDFPVPDNSTPVIEEPKEETILFPQEAATFNGCVDPTCFLQWVNEHIVYPEIAADAGVKGKVIIQFCVNAKGEVVDVIIVKRLDPAIDAETVRVISSSPRWTPARQGGKPVKTQFTIPFTFDLI